MCSLVWIAVGQLVTCAIPSLADSLCFYYYNFCHLIKSNVVHSAPVYIQACETWKKQTSPTNKHNMKIVR